MRATAPSRWPTAARCSSTKSGELPLPLQAQLLRVVQEHSYKRVGGNIWQHTDFRLVCATNRDLEAGVARGQFRADLYYRIAGWHVPHAAACASARKTSSRSPGISCAQFDRHGSALEFDDPVREYLLTRDYPATCAICAASSPRLHHRHAGPGPITIGDVPEDERPAAAASQATGWRDAGSRARSAMRSNWAWG